MVCMQIFHSDVTFYLQLIYHSVACMNLQDTEPSKLADVEEWCIVDKLLEAKLALSCS